MKKRGLIFGILLLIILFVCSKEISADNWCYQESANVSTSCGGLNNTANPYVFGGTYPWRSSGTPVIDGSWSTSDAVVAPTSATSNMANLFINYTIPNGATSSSLWQVKDALETVNLSLSLCTNFTSGDSIRLFVESWDICTAYIFNCMSESYNVKWYCVNRTGGNYVLLKNTITGTAYVYEEAMLWNMPLINCTNLNSAGNTYTLGNDILNNQLTSACINITAQNITLDCQGHSISSIQNYSGVYSNQYNTTIKNCNISVGSGDTSGNANAISLKSATYGTVFNNTLSGSYNGISLDTSSYNNLTNNNATGNALAGIYLLSSNYNTLVNNNCTSSQSPGIFFNYAMNNTLINNTATGATSGVSMISYSHNNKFYNQKSNGATYGLYTQDTNNTFFQDCLNISGGSYDVYLFNSLNTTFTNCSYILSKENLVSNSQLIRKWYYRAYANSTNGNSVPSQMNATNNTGNLEFSINTNSSGWTNITTITDYMSNGTRYYYSNYTINAANSSYLNSVSHTYNASLGNNLNDYFTFTNPPVLLNFTYPTPANATQTTNTSININVSISAFLNELKWNWNSTNYTLYNDSLILMYNFDNNTNIGDSMVTITDASKYGNNGIIDSGFLDNFELGVNGWIARDGGWLAPAKDCTTANGGNCSINMTTTTVAAGSVFINSTQVYPESGMRVEFDYKCENSNFKWGLMVYNNSGIWSCIQGTGNSTCGGGYYAMGALNPAITCDNTWRHASYNMNLGSGTFSQTILGDWGGANTANQRLWIDNFVIHSASTYTLGRYGNAMSFDGVNDYIITPNFSNGFIPTGFALASWFKTSSSAGIKTILRTAGSCPSGSCDTAMVVNWTSLDLTSTNKLTCGGYNGTWTNQYAMGLSNVNDNNWHYGVCVFNGTAMFVYVDGHLENSVAIGKPSYGNLPWYIGRYPNSNIELFNGTIDEVRIYNRSLSADEIYELYASNLQKYNSTQWYLQVNQSGPTGKIVTGTYTYFASAKDPAGNYNATEVRTININNNPNINFTNPTPANQTSTTNTSIFVNVSISEPSLSEGKWNWNSVNYTLYNDSLILMYNFENKSELGENSTYFVDLSKYGNNGNCTIGAGTCPALNTSGKYGNALTFDGINDFIMTGNATNNLGTPNQPYTISGWVKIAQGVTNGNIIHTASCSSGSSCWCVTMVSVSNGKFNVSSWTGAGVTVSGTTTLQPNNWYHFTNTWDATNGLRLYVNGILENNVAQANYSASGSNNYFFLGYYGSTCQGSTGIYLNGSIDEVRIYNRSLSADEVNELYMSNLQKFNQTQWYLTVNQSMNPGTYNYFASAKDTAGNGNMTDIRMITTSGIGGCFNLTTANFVYNLANDVLNNQITSTCINITAQNVTLDCQGHYIFSIQNYSGIWTNQINSTIQNCNVTMGSGANINANGIYLYASNYSKLSNNTALGNSYLGIALTSYSNNNLLTNNSGTSGVGYGIVVSQSDNNTLINNTGVSNINYGIQINYGNKNTLINSIGISNSSYGIFLQLSSNNTLINNTGASNSSYGIFLSSSNNTIMINNTGTSNSSAALSFSSSSNNTIYNQIATGYLSGSTAIYISSSNNNLFQDCLNISGATNLNLNSNSLNNTFLNCSYSITGANETIDSTSQLIRKWYYMAYANDTLGNPVSSQVNATNRTGGLDFSTNTASNGWTNITTITDYINNGTKNYYSNYTLSAFNFSYPIFLLNHTYNASMGNNLNDYFTFSFNVNNCSNLSIPNMIYPLINNISNNQITSVCINITTQNITFDCQGRYISSIQNISGVYTNKYNTTIRNCNLTVGSGGNTNANGIYLSSSNFSTIFNNVAGGTPYIGLYLSSCSNNNLTNNIATGNPTYGIYLSSSSNNTIINNTGTSNSSMGIYIWGSSNNILINNTGMSNLSTGILFSSSSNSTLMNNIGTSNSGIGFYLSSSSNNILTNNTGTSNSSAGVYLSSFSLNNILTNNTGMSNSLYGIYFSSSSNNTLINNTGTSNSSIGVYLQASRNNTIYNQIALGYLSGSSAINLTNSNNTLFQDCVNVSGATDVNVNTNSINTTFLNCSYDTYIGANETVDATSSLIRKWYYRAYTNDTSGNNVSAMINATNRTGTLEFSINTNSGGWTNITPITDYVTNGTRYYYSNYTLNATAVLYAKYPNSTNHIYNASLGNNFNDLFTFLCVPLSCLNLGYECGNWSDGCRGTLNCGSCSGTCTNGKCFASGGGNQDGAGGGGIIPLLNITFIPNQINLQMIINTNANQTIQITNNENTTKIFSISQTGLTNMIILENTSLALAAGETKNIGVIFVAPNYAGIFTGKIIVGNREIPVTLNVKEKLLLFDSSITVLNRNYMVSPGTDLKIRIKIVPMGDKERMDVQLNYFIKDFTGKVYMTQTETVLVENQMQFNRNFRIGDFPLGKYIFGLELVYPNGIAPSSANFEIVKQTPTSFFSNIVFFLLISFIVVSIAIVIVFIRIRIKKQRE